MIGSHSGVKVPKQVEVFCGRGSLWWRIQAPHRTHPYSQLMSIVWEHRCSGSSLGPRRSKGKERGCRLCCWMEVQQQTVESFSLQSPHHAVLFHLVPFPAKRMCGHVPWGCHSKGVWSPCSAAMSMLSLLSSQLMMAVFLKSSTSCRSLEGPGHIVLTFKPASHKNCFFFLGCELCARFIVCLSVFP